MTSVTFPDSVCYIGCFAFSYCSLTSIELGNGVKESDYCAFENRWDGSGHVIPEHPVTIYYPSGNPTWTVEAKLLIADNATWIAVPQDSQDPEVPGDLDGVEGVSEDDAIYLLQHVLMPDLFPLR